MTEQTSEVCVTATPANRQRGEALAAELGLSYVSDFPGEATTPYDYALVVTDAYLGLQEKSARKFAPFYIDFLAGKLRYRREAASLKREALARALSAKPKEALKMVDATAGLGRDSFILASLGFQMILLEQSPIVFALLRDALARAANDSATAAIVQRMQLYHADAVEWLNAQNEAERPDIVYLDPMFPARDKSASVKKEMVILQNLLGKSSDSETLLNTALACSKRRVVVKRPRLAGTLTNLAPNYTLEGKSSRFDIYLV